jgi:FixJ family two-component response regulator
MPQVRNVLIVDDEPQVCGSVRKVLLKEDYNVDMAFSGQEALDKIKDGSYSVAVIDIKMPGMSGMELLRILRKDYPNLKPIIMTGYSTIETAVEAIKLGALDYIPKPFTPNKIRTTVKKALELETEGEERQREIIESLKKMGKEEKEIYDYEGKAWAQIEERDSVRIGVDDSYRKELGEIESVNLPNKGDIINQGDNFLELLTTKRKLYKLPSPLTGEVVETNFSLSQDGTLINRDPKGEGWAIILKPSNLDKELEKLKK